jgi:hypothetical protein
MQLERGRLSRTGAAASPGKRGSKPTLAGTEANVALRKRTIVALVVGVVALAAASTGVLAVKRLDRAPTWPKEGSAAVSAIEGGGERPLSTAVVMTATTEAMPSEPPVDGAAPSATPAGPPLTSPALTATEAPNEIARTAPPAVSAPPPAGNGTSTSRGKWAHAGSGSTPHVKVAPPPPTSVPIESEGAVGPDPIEQLIAPPPTAPSGPFDPARAHVEIGAISVQGVTEPALRAALRSAGFTGCYRTALRQRGAAAAGVANLSVSIEASGVIRGVVLNGAEFLPEVRGCIQSGAASIRVPPSTVDPLGGTADVSLFFKMP